MMPSFAAQFMKKGGLSVAMVLRSKVEGSWHPEAMAPPGFRAKVLLTMVTVPPQLSTPPPPPSEAMESLSVKVQLMIVDSPPSV
jgi:hypothetical protein